SYLALDPESQQQIISAVAEQVEQVSLQEETAILLCSPAVRMYVKQLLDRFLPQVTVLSYNELEPNVEVQSVGVVNVA
ncbi:FHIPEP family type III secretion protein, partial [Halobacillus sp. BBL2006]|uniref:FHIPEP family type III secretion protein n=1 Tax=Halobacillus sp. BBL2006 TaxID=1543706 RepID=UPI000542FAB4